MPDVVLPVLDEAQALPWVLGRLPDGYRAIVVDNGSTDGSGEIAAGLGALVVREPRPGFGSACFAGLMAATDDVVCFVDADGSLDPWDLPIVADPVTTDAYDLVLGARRPARGAWPWHARLANRALALEMRRRGARPALRDIGPMRAARRTALLDLGLRDRRFGWPLEMVVRAGRAGWRIQEVDVPYAARKGGRSKVTGTVRGTVRTVRDMSRVLAEDRAAGDAAFGRGGHDRLADPARPGDDRAGHARPDDAIPVGRPDAGPGRPFPDDAAPAGRRDAAPRRPRRGAIPSDGPGADPAGRGSSRSPPRRSGTGERP